MDSSGVRHAHRTGALQAIRLPARIVLSPLTWQPTPDALRASAVAPELRFPDPRMHSVAGRVQLSELDPRSDPHPTAALCEALETMHATGAVVLSLGDACDPLRVAEVEQMWMPAGLIGRPIDESIAAILAAEQADLPFVCADVSVQRLARRCGLHTMTVAEFVTTTAA